MVKSETNRRPIIGITALILGLMLVVTACGTNSSTESDGMETVVITAREHPDYGTILTDEEGMTLYVYADDEAGISHCTDACAENWPPLTTSDDAAAGENVPGQVDIFDRDDGSPQVAYEDMPLYYFKGDEKPGDANGHRLQGEWFVIRLENFQ